jgi:hypothetical protein
VKQLRNKAATTAPFNALGGMILSMVLRKAVPLLP